LQLATLDILARVFQSDAPITEEQFRDGLQLPETTWKQILPEVMKFITGIPNVLSPTYQSMGLFCIFLSSSDCVESTQKMVILCGLPASGKSTFANRMVEANPVRCIHFAFSIFSYS
jgi:hypothetical protein